MSMMNANVAATTVMTANKPLDFELPEIMLRCRVSVTACILYIRNA